MHKKTLLIPLILICLSGCTENYRANPTENNPVVPPPTQPEVSIEQPKPAVINPSKSLKTQAIINFVGKVTLKKTNDLTSYIHKQMLSGVKDFVININSAGGDSDAGVSAYEYLKQLPISITTYNVGHVQSSAALIYCSGSKRYSLPHSFFMLHGSSTTYPESMSFIEIEALSKLSKIHRQSFIDIISTCTNISLSQLEKYFSSADLQYFTAIEAKEIGLVNEAVAPVFSKSASFYSITDEK
jgi:ATP-dependent Clp protease protease subunit